MPEPSFHVEKQNFSNQGDAARRLFYIVSGEASIQIGRDYYLLKQEQVWEDGSLKEERRDRLIIPPGTDYNVRMGEKAILAFASTEYTDPESAYDEGILLPLAGRTLLFDRSWAGFTAKQLKFLMPFDKDVILGGHYHDYGEAYSMLQGGCIFRLEDIANPAKREEVSLSAQEGNHLTMKPQLAHVAKAGARSILVGYTAEAFEGADSAVKYQNDWLMFKE